MSRCFYVKITGGTAPGPYTVYYNSISESNIATVQDTSLPATGLTYSGLTTLYGIKVNVPDSITNLILYNEKCDEYFSNSAPPAPTSTPTPTPTSTPTPTANTYLDSYKYSNT